MKRHLLFALAGITSLLSCTAEPESLTEPPKVPPLPDSYRSELLEITPLSDRVFQHISYIQLSDSQSFPCNGLIYFDLDSQQAVVIDAPTSDSAAVELIKWIQQERKSQLSSVVVTHHHEDCLGGLKAFHNDGVPSYAQLQTIPLAKEKDHEAPQLGFEKYHELFCGNQPIQCFWPGRGHANDNIVVYLPEEQTLFGGCLIKALDAGKGYLGDATLEEWTATVKRVQNRFPSISQVIPGHGNPGDSSLLIYTQDLFKPDTLRMHPNWRRRQEDEQSNEYDFGTFKVKLAGPLRLQVMDKPDTIFVEEGVGEYLYDRRLTLSSINPEDSFALWFKAFEELTEQYQPGDTYPTNQEWYAWEKTRVSWKEYSDWAYIKDSVPGVYQLPALNELPYNYEGHGPLSLALKEKLNLRDTFVHYDSEGGMNYSNFVYQDKPCYYWIYTGLLKIVRVGKNDREEKYIRIYFSYGC